MAIAFVHNLGQSSVATQQAATIQLAVNTTQFNTVTVRCHSTAGNNVTSIMDSQGNQYVPAQPSTAPNATAEIWYGFLATALVSGNTITVFFEKSVAGTAATADEWSGVLAAAALDVTAENSSATTTVTVGPTATASVAGSLVLTAAGGSGTGTWTYPGGAYTNLAVPGGTTAYQGAYQVAGGVGGFSATWAVTGATSMEAVIAVFTPALSTGFKLFPLPYIVELLVAGVWQDITNYVYTRDGIQITGGRSDATVTNSDPATCSMTLDNRDGRFTPNYSGGAYFPNLTRNLQLRVSIANATSSSGNVYSGVRFWGKVADWPPQSDISGTDVYVQISASGPLREIRAGGGKGSALTRYYATLTGAFAPVAYWPCEEDADTDTIGAGIAGGSNMTITAGTPVWKAISSFDGAIPVPIVNYSTWDGATGSLGSTGNDVFSIPGVYQWTATTSTVDCRVWGGGGGAENGWRGCAGGGGEFAREASLAVTPGNQYTVYVGGGGYGGAGGTFGNHNGGPGAQSSVAGDSVTVTAHGGLFGVQDNGGAGGSGSVNTQHGTGGTGGSNPSDHPGGCGGGSSAGFSGSAPINGNNGANSAGNSGANGGPAVTGGGAGGKGGFGSSTGGNGQNGFAGGAPGGGGGGGGDSVGGEGNYAGGAGGAGQVQFIYTPATGPTTIVVRFIMMVPKHGGNPGKVLLRFFTGSTVLSRLDVTYALGGKLRLQGFNGSNVQQFDSTAQSWAVDGQPIMVSVELVQSGANVNWAFKAITPGATSLLGGGASGTVTTATLGNCSEVTVSPNADISSTAIGHISLQYALIPLTTVSAHLAAHSQELTVDRFIRLASEQAIDNAVQFAETQDHFGFEAGVQSWVGTNGTLSSSPVTIVGQWPTQGTNSLLLTANGVGQPTANSPTGTGGLPVNVGDIVSVAADIMAPTALAHMFLGILWYQASGVACAHATDVTADTVLVSNTATHFQIRAIAPATAAFFAVIFGDHNTDANNTLMYLDHVRISPQMGKQTWKEYHAFLEEIEDLDQGIMKEARKLHGLHFRTRIALINQSPAVTLDYNGSEVTTPLIPVVDSQNVRNDITIKRHHGTSVRVIQTVGSMSVFEPPAGTGRFKKILRVAANEDKQLAALATHLLNLGTVTDERYPTVTVDLTRCQAKGGGLPPLMSAVAGVEIGDYIQIINLPFWMPSATAKQLVIGYTETININQWTIVWNCTPESPWEIVASALRRW